MLYIHGYIRRLLLIVCGCLMSGGMTAHAADYPSKNTNYIDSLDSYLKRANVFTDKALQRLLDERAALKGFNTDERLSRLADIGADYEQISIDSAMAVYTRAANYAKMLGNKRFINKFAYRRGSVLTMMGLVSDGIKMYQMVSPDSIPDQDKFDYYTTGKHIYDAAADYYSIDSLRTKYESLSARCATDALRFVAPGSVEERYYNALPKLLTDEQSIGIAELTDVMSRIDVTDPLFAKAAAEIASAAAAKGDHATARYYLAVSAIGDLIAGTRETTSLHRLGYMLFEEDDYERAYDYLAYSLESAVASGSRLRSVEISEIMPVVVKAGRELESRRTRTLTIVVISLSVAIVIFVAIILYALHTHRRLNRMRAQLAALNDSKDAYIRKLISLCGVYLTALENFNKLAGRKIKVGQVHELLIMIESGKVMREQLQTFYEVFDDAFLTVYPDFVDRVNELLQPDRRLALTEDGRLGTELRILAFMRLGMDDSAQIAKFLGLSLNTVYTYRNKVKTRAINRADFENQVKNISKSS